MKKLQIKLDTAYDVFEFLLKTIYDNFENNASAYAYVSHLMSPFFASKSDFKLIKKIQNKGNIHYVCRSNSPLDKILSQFYNGFGSKVRLGANLKFKDDIYLIKDMVIKIKVPDNFKRDIDRLYFDTKSILSFNMMKFFKSFAEKKVGFDVKIEGGKGNRAAK